MDSYDPPDRPGARGGWGRVGSATRRAPAAVGAFQLARVCRPNDTHLRVARCGEPNARGRGARTQVRRQPLPLLQVGKFYPPYRGGMETHLHALCAAIRDHVDLRIIVANTSRETVEEEIDGIPVTRL